jgi:hypothetical protein
MHRSGGRRRTAARITAWGVVAIAYAAVLAFASGIPAGPAEPATAVAAPAAAEVATVQAAGVLAAAPAGARVDEVVTVATAPAGAAEEPAVTLALAAGMVVLAGLAYGGHALHGRLARRAASRQESVAQLVARQITTLM